MIFVFTNDLKATNRSAVSFSTARYPGRRSSVLSTVEISFLFLQAHDDRCPAGMLLRQVRRDHVGQSAAAVQNRERPGERTKIVKVDSLLDQTKCMQNRRIVVHYQRRFCRGFRSALFPVDLRAYRISLYIVSGLRCDQHHALLELFNVR